ncbi:MAG: hypothetical protein P4L50_07020 [Anaerolineaceae bacterium]|nr:hypothetical protein [Anaerolineaceae bacterium]
MIYERGILAVVAAAFALSPAIAPAKSPRPFKVHTRFLATSTCIRGTWGLNLDVYLAEIFPAKESAPVLVRLIDEYRNLDPPLSVSALISETGTTLRVRRDQQCDMPYGQMQLRTAPGDPMTILHERLGYQPHLASIPAPNAVLPCYKTVRP